MAGPLSHLKVLDLSRIMAGPWAAQMLADLGADVIKVERPGIGDDTRRWGPPYLRDACGTDTSEAGYYLAVNRGKRSITLALDKPEGQRIARDLAARSDILLENFKVGTLARYGLDYDSLKTINPRLVYCSITGFGQTGPRRDQAAYDFAIQAMGGLMSITGEPDGEPGGGPQKAGVPICDLTTGMYAVVSVLAALARREISHRGDYIDIGMLDVQTAMLCNQAMNFLTTGRAPRRSGNAHPNIQPQDVFACRDGAIVLAVGNNTQFAQLCNVLGHPHLATEERYATNANRVTNRHSLLSLLRAEFLRNTRKHWIEQLEAAGVPCAPINSIPDLFEDDQVKHRQMQLDLPHPTAGHVPLVGSPIKFRNAPINYRRHPPLLGEHTAEILAELGIDAPHLAALLESGVV